MNLLKKANIAFLLSCVIYFSYDFIAPYVAVKTWGNEYKLSMFNCDNSMREHFIAKKAIEMDYPFLPGVSNSSDIMKLLDLGYKSFKFFPAQAAGGINYLKSLNGPFPGILFCPTGGINEENASQWISQKNVICVGGSWIVPSEAHNYKEITNCKTCLKINQQFLFMLNFKLKCPDWKRKVRINDKKS